MGSTKGGSSSAGGPFLFGQTGSGTTNKPVVPQFTAGLLSNITPTTTAISLSQTTPITATVVTTTQSESG